MNEANHEVSAAVAKMQAYIKAHLHEPMTSGDIAKSAGYSQYHAARLFKGETGLSPFEYIRRERLLQSARALRNGKAKVLDVALDFVFDSHEGFTRAFASAFGITPKKYATHPKPDGWLIPYRYLDRHKTKPKSEEFEMDKETKTAVIFTQIMERPARKLILKRSKKATDYFTYCEEVGCAEDENGEYTGAPLPWVALGGIKEALYEVAGVWLPENMRPEGTGTCAAAVEVPADYAGEIPEGFDVIDLEPCKMIVFQGEPYKDEDWQEAIGFCMEQFGKFNPEVYGYEYADELAPRMQLAPQSWRGYIEMRPVREMRQEP
ncbi:MAG: AraC family transcriptional regulator [Oscillospiraceae bacterium]|nr:AraC family transcriptional regulator [Oscillospiraceae bacterium]